MHGSIRAEETLKLGLRERSRLIILRVFTFILANPVMGVSVTRL